MNKNDKPRWLDEALLGLAIACCLIGLAGVVALAAGLLP